MADRMIHQRLAGAVAVLICIAAPVFGQNRSSFMSHQQMEAFIIGPSCGMTVHIEIRSPSGAYFAGNRIDVQRLAGGASQNLQFSCSQLKRVTFSGTVSGQLVFAGLTRADANWQLEGLYAPLEN